MSITQKYAHLSYRPKGIASGHASWAGLGLKTFLPQLESNNLKPIPTWSPLMVAEALALPSELHWLETVERTDKHNLKCILNCFVGHSDHRSHMYFRLISNFINKQHIYFCEVIIYYN